jgi:uncharacterized membrane protein YqjE
MLRSLLHLFATQPQLLAEHAQGYADLIGAQTAQAASAWRRRALLHAGALISAAVAAVLIGVALMLWAITPGLSAGGLWALVLVPVPPAALALGCWRSARVPAQASPFEAVREQLQADLKILREEGSA